MVKQEKGKKRTSANLSFSLLYVYILFIDAVYVNFGVMPFDYKSNFE